MNFVKTLRSVLMEGYMALDVPTWPMIANIAMSLLIIFIICFIIYVVKKSKRR